MTFKENAAQNVLPVVYTAGSFHVILDMCISTLNAMEYFTNKKLSMKLHWKLYVMSSGVQWSMEFHLKGALRPVDGIRLESYPLGHLQFELKLWWTVIGSLPSLTSSRSHVVLFCLKSFSRALEAPQEHGG